MSADRGNELFGAALRYTRHGWPVFPCWPGQKNPLTPHGFKDATTDIGVIEGWWARWPTANVAIRTGSPSGIVVLDVDGDDGTESLRKLEREHGELPRTLSIVTPRGGQHFYFAHPGGHVSLSTSRLGDKLDVRGDGGYVIAPPSVSAAQGRQYEVDERCSLAPLPEWLRQLTRSADRDGLEPAPPSEWLVILRRDLPEGRRNDALTRLTGYLLRRRVHVDVAAELVHLVNAQRCEPPLPREEVDRIIDSIAGREATRRERR